MIDNNQPVSWGILSTGRIAEWFTTDLAFVDGAKAVAVCSRSAGSAKAFAAKHDVPAAYSDYAAFLDDPAIDVVYVGTPHTHHFEAAKSALEAGKAVLCEKPLVTNPDACRQLIHAAQSTGVYLMEAMWTYFLPAIQRAQAWIAEGRIGTLRHIKADFGYPLPYDPAMREYDVRLGGGALLEMGIYPVAIDWLFRQQRPDALYATAHLAPNGAEDDLSATLLYPDGTTTLSTSFRCKLQNWAYIIGDKGYVAIPDFWRASECFLYKLDTVVDHFKDDRLHQGFAYEAAAVGDDLRAGRTQSKIMPHEASQALQDTMALIRDAARRSGR